MKRILKWVASLALTVAVAGTTFLPAMTANAAEAEGTEKVYTTSCDMAKFIYQGYFQSETGKQKCFRKKSYKRCLHRRSCRN